MQIIIKNPKNRKLAGFIQNRLLPIMYNMIVQNIDKDIYQLYDSKLKHTIQSMFIQREYLYYYQLPSNDFVITLESNKIVGENSAKLCDICSLINYGSLDYPATEVFTKVFNHIQQNFWKIYKFYTVGAII